MKIGACHYIWGAFWCCNAVGWQHTGEYCAKWLLPLRRFLVLKVDNAMLCLVGKWMVPLWLPRCLVRLLGAVGCCDCRWGAFLCCRLAMHSGTWWENKENGCLNSDFRYVWGTFWCCRLTTYRRACCKNGCFNHAVYIWGAFWCCNAVGWQHTAVYGGKVAASTVVSGAVGWQHTGEYCAKWLLPLRRFLVLKVDNAMLCLVGKWMVPLWLPRCLVRLLGAVGCCDCRWGAFLCCRLAMHSGIWWENKENGCLNSDFRYVWGTFWCCRLTTYRRACCKNGCFNHAVYIWGAFWCCNAVGWQHTAVYGGKVAASTVVSGAVGWQHTGEYCAKWLLPLRRFLVLKVDNAMLCLVGKWMVPLWLPRCLVRLLGAVGCCDCRWGAFLCCRLAMHSGTWWENKENGCLNSDFRYVWGTFWCCRLTTYRRACYKNGCFNHAVYIWGAFWCCNAVGWQHTAVYGGKVAASTVVIQANMLGKLLLPLWSLVL